jgi:hypothetical protein
MLGTSQPPGPRFWSLLVNPWDPKFTKICTRPYAALSGVLSAPAFDSAGPSQSPHSQLGPSQAHGNNRHSPLRLAVQHPEPPRGAMVWSGLGFGPKLDQTGPPSGPQAICKTGGVQNRLRTVSECLKPNKGILLHYI